MGMHVRLDGEQFAYNRPSTVKIEPFSVIVDTTDLAVGLVETAFGAVTQQDFLFLLRNISTAGQSIRIGGPGDVTFGPPGKGVLLYPGESIELLNTVGYVWAAIADAAAGLLNIRSLSTLV